MLNTYAKRALASLSVVIAFIAMISANGVYRPPDRYINYCSSSNFGLSARCYNELICDNYCFSNYNSYVTVPTCKGSSAYSVPADPNKTRFFTLEGLYGYYNPKEYTSFRFLVSGDKYGETVAVKIYYDWNGDNRWDRVESFDSFHIYKAGKQLVWYENYPSSVIGDQSYKNFYNGRIKVVFWQYGSVQGDVRIITDCAGRQFSSALNLPYDSSHVWDHQPGHGKRDVVEQEESVMNVEENAVEERGIDDSSEYGRGVSYSSRCPVVVTPVSDCSVAGSCKAETEFAVIGRVFNDTNQNGLDDDTANFLPSVEITLYRVNPQNPNGPGTFVRKISLDSGNNEKRYIFTGLPAGKYYIVFSSPAVTVDGMFIWTCSNRGYDEIKDSDVDRFGRSEIFTLACGADNIYKNTIGLAEANCYYNAIKAGAERNNPTACRNYIPV